jgi:hypothetical protein
LCSVADGDIRVRIVTVLASGDGHDLIKIAGDLRALDPHRSIGLQ